MPYPTILLDESNHEIEDCTVLHALKGMFVKISLNDGKSWDYVEITDYDEGLLWFTANYDSEIGTYQLMVPITSVDTITYI
jgi:hypothetical protein